MTKLECDFLSTYDIVFDEHGDVKSCGRDMTKALITLASELDTGKNFGDLHTGYMCVQNIQQLKNLIERTSR